MQTIVDPYLKKEMYNQPKALALPVRHDKFFGDSYEK